MKGEKNLGNDYISSLEISDLTLIEHKEIMKKIRKIANRLLIDISKENDLIKIGTYMDNRNRVKQQYHISNSITLELVKSFNRLYYEEGKKVLKYIGEESDNFKITPKIVLEHQFYQIIANLLIETKIHRQYPISSYLVDFYIPELNILIEFDEKYHERSEQKRKDAEREKEIITYAQKEINQNIHMIRVKEDDIYAGIRRILNLAYKRHSVLVS